MLAPNFAAIARHLDLSGVNILTQMTPTAVSPSQLERVGELVASSRIGLVEAVRNVSRQPARAAGIDHHVGAIAPGLGADLLVVDPYLSLQRVMRDGIWRDDRHHGQVAAVV